MNGQSFRYLKGGPTNWGYVLILMFVTLLIAGGILSYSRYVFNEIVFLSQFPEIEMEKPEKVEVKIDWEKSPFPAEISANSKFREYIGRFLKANPELKIEEFEGPEIKEITTIKVPGILPPPLLAEPPKEAIWEFSPDGKRAVSVLTYYGEPDSELAIYNRNGEKRRERLAFCGPPCQWYTAFWLNSEQFITIFVAVYYSDEKPSCRPITTPYCCFHEINLYDISKNTITSYSYPPLDNCLNNPWAKENCEKVFGKGSPECQF